MAQDIRPVVHTAPRQSERLGECMDAIANTGYAERGFLCSDMQLDGDMESMAVYFPPSTRLARQSLMIIHNEWTDLTHAQPPAHGTELEAHMRRMVGEILTTHEMGQVGIRTIYQYGLLQDTAGEYTTTREHSVSLQLRQGVWHPTLAGFVFGGAVERSIEPKAKIRDMANDLSRYDEEDFARIEQAVAWFDGQ